MDDRTVVEYFKAPVGDGGVWNLYYNAAEKYGVVPQEVMPETAHSNNTSQMVSIINERLRQGFWPSAWVSLLISLRGDIRIKTGISKSWPITRRNSSTKKSPRPTTVLPTIS